MKIREIDIENFGVFTDRHFDFGESSFQLIHGPNEAGKSTLLHLLRQLLFGFPARSQYAFENHSGEMAARAMIDTSDGRRISFRRRKGRKGTVVGEVEGTTEKIDEASLNRILGNANLDLYQHVFGFSLNELAKGEESLKHANLNEAMFGGSLGSPSNLQEIQKSLDAESTGLFKSTGTKPVINSLLREIRSRNTEIKGAILKPREFEDKEKALRAAEEQVASLSDSREKVQKKLSHLNRLCEAVQPWLEQLNVQAELDQITVPDSVTPASDSEMQQLQNDLSRAESALKEAENELAETTQALQSLTLCPEVLGVEAEIRSLEKELSRVERDLKQIPQLKGQSQAILADVRSRLADLNPDWELSYLESFQSSLEQREQLDELVARQAELEKRQAEAIARRPDLKQRVEVATSRLAELENVQAVPEVDEILERESEFRSATENLKESEAAEQALNNQLAAIRTRLTPVLIDPEMADSLLAALPVPLESLLRSFQDRHCSAASELEKAESLCQQISDSLKDRRTELDTTTANDQVPDRFQLEEQRTRRDSGWKLIRAKFLAEFNNDHSDSDNVAKNLDQKIEEWTSQSNKSLPELYEQEVSEADHLADDRQAKAKTVAIRDRLATEIRQLEDSLAEAKQQQDLKRQAFEKLTDEWDKLLDGFNVKPYPPEVILEWQRTLESWLDVRSKMIDCKARSTQLREQISQFEKLLSEHSNSELLADADATTAQQLAVIRQRSDEIRKSELERQQIEKSLPADRDSLERLDKDESRLAEEQTAWTQEWSTLLNGFGFTENWSPRIASKMLQGLHDAKQKYVEATSLTAQTETLQDEVTAFDREARSVCTKIRPELSEFPISDLVNRLCDDLTRATEAERQQVSLLQNKDRFQQRVKACQKEVLESSSQIDELLKAASAKSPDEFQQLAQQAKRKQELNSELATLSRDLNRLAGAEDVDTFLKELAESDTDTLPLKRDEIQQEHQQIEEARDEALRSESEARSALEAMDGTSKAAALQLEQESAYAQLGSAIDRLAPLLLAQTLLKRAIERFEKEHQPAMLAEVGRLLSRMTAGRYVGIRRRLDEAGTMQVEQDNGKLKTPDQLSTGTREQLYLAIRLAYVQHYCQESEPLPLIMDDILVNFDEQRAKNTLEVLFDLPANIQVLFLTCHEHIAETIRKSRPELIPIELSPA